MSSKETRALVREARRQGWRVELTRGGHIAFYAPDGEGIVHASATASDYRSLDAVIAGLRQHGFRWKRR